MAIYATYLLHTHLAPTTSNMGQIYFSIFMHKNVCHPCSTSCLKGVSRNKEDTGALTPQYEKINEPSMKELY